LQKFGVKCYVTNPADKGFTSIHLLAPTCRNWNHNPSNAPEWFNSRCQTNWCWYLSS